MNKSIAILCIAATISCSYAKERTVSDDSQVKSLMQEAEAFVAQKRAEGWTQKDFADGLQAMFDEKPEQLHDARAKHAATVDDLLDAIREVETGSSKDPNHAVGDQGRSHGAYQIMRGYYNDAVPYCKAMGYTLPSYEATCANAGYSRICVKGYWQRYAKADVTAGNLEALARTHNGGPAGRLNPNTLPYWYKVQAILRKRGLHA